MTQDYQEMNGYVADADLGLGCGLPTQFARIKRGDTVVDLGAGVVPAGLPDFIIAKVKETPIGVAGLESFGLVGLLRSVAIDPTYQGKGIATQLIERLLASADSNRLQELYLITTTANTYFERHGFTPISRDQVPTAIQHTQQVSNLCPSSAVVMKRQMRFNPVIFQQP